MRVLAWLFGMIVLLPQSQLAQAVSAGGISKIENAGLKLFLQRCSVCHLGAPPRYQAYGPVLHQELVAARGDDAVRKKIMEGSELMPGFQYTLKRVDVDTIMAYLRVVKKADVTAQRSEGSADRGD